MSLPPASVRLPTTASSDRLFFYGKATDGANIEGERTIERRVIKEEEGFLYKRRKEVEHIQVKKGEGFNV
nr:hypothetical protein CFP56_57460 [Quercus suber]